jgi:hypothetical protein
MMLDRNKLNEKIVSDMKDTDLRTKKIITNIIQKLWEEHYSAVTVGPLLWADSKTGGKIWAAIAFRNGGYWSIFRVWGSAKAIENGKGITSKIEFPQIPQVTSKIDDWIESLSREKINTNPSYSPITQFFYYDQSGQVSKPTDPPEPNKPFDLADYGYGVY